MYMFPRSWCDRRVFFRSKYQNIMAKQFLRTHDEKRDTMGALVDLVYFHREITKTNPSLHRKLIRIKTVI